MYIRECWISFAAICNEIKAPSISPSRCWRVHNVSTTWHGKRILIRILSIISVRCDFWIVLKSIMDNLFSVCNDLWYLPESTAVFNTSNILYRHNSICYLNYSMKLRFVSSHSQHVQHTVIHTSGSGIVDLPFIFRVDSTMSRLIQTQNCLIFISKEMSSVFFFIYYEPYVHKCDRCIKVCPCNKLPYRQFHEFCQCEKKKLK